MRSDAIIIVGVGFQGRKCISPKTMMWSTHSRRIDPISRSATPFCQGEAGAVGFTEPGSQADFHEWLLLAQSGHSLSNAYETLIRGTHLYLMPSMAGARSR